MNANDTIQIAVRHAKPDHVPDAYAKAIEESCVRELFDKAKKLFTSSQNPHKILTIDLYHVGRFGREVTCSISKNPRTASGVNQRYPQPHTKGRRGRGRSVKLEWIRDNQAEIKIKDINH
ncbi:MAG: hypothetical protein N4J56_001775 [Chroococcidiopsis sp. SAG 2025]|nr:hypothetical protein [Chroococcidiopsis sp. SAG 2025]